MFSDLDVTASETSDQTLALVRRTEPDVVLFDLGAAREPQVAAQSLELLRQILNISPDTKIIAMTEHDARELAVAAVGLGAADFYHKPLDAGVLSIVVRRALRIRELEEENWRLRERTGAMALEGILGVSDAMRACAARSRKLRPQMPRCCCSVTAVPARSCSHAPYTGFPGVRTNSLSRSTARPFPKRYLRASCSAMKGRLHRARPSAPPASSESADGGTVFFDEIGEMPTSLQAKCCGWCRNEP